MYKQYWYSVLNRHHQGPFKCMLVHVLYVMNILLHWLWYLFMHMYICMILSCGAIVGQPTTCKRGLLQLDNTMFPNPSISFKQIYSEILWLAECSLLHKTLGQIKTIVEVTSTRYCNLYWCNWNSRLKGASILLDGWEFEWTPIRMIFDSNKS